MSNSLSHHPSSYRDPSGFIFEKESVLYRQVNISFKDHFDHFIESGCYAGLAGKKLLIPHEIISENITGSPDYYKTLRPEPICFISYPYEWCFDMVKDAALLTLEIMKESLQFNMIVKDATAFNIQWHNGKLIFIDTLSFEKYEEKPWIAYRQFCENFLGPLLIMHYSKKQLPELMLAWPDGIPLTIVSSLLPKRSRFSLYTYLHIHLHAKYSVKRSNKNSLVKKFSRQKLLNLLGSLETLVGKLKTPAQMSNWSGYYEEAAGRQDYLEQKKKIISAWVEGIKNVKLAADLGANEGEFSKLLAAKGIPVVAADSDPGCIAKLYTHIKTNREKKILPVVLDLSRPSPAIGVNNEERVSFLERSKFDLVLALALLHHLAIGKNISFEMIADMFSRAGKQLIIEFVPKEDEKIKGMLLNKKDIYTGYNEDGFTRSFEKYYSIIDKKNIPGSGRILFLMRRHEK